MTEYDWHPIHDGKTEPVGVLQTDYHTIRCALVTNATDRQKRDAARHVASRAFDVEDCSMLLEMLGLTAIDGKSISGSEVEEG